MGSKQWGNYENVTTITYPLAMTDYQIYSTLLTPRVPKSREVGAFYTTITQTQITVYIRRMTDEQYNAVSNVAFRGSFLMIGKQGNG